MPVYLPHGSPSETPATANTHADSDKKSHRSDPPVAFFSCPVPNAARERRRRNRCPRDDKDLATRWRTPTGILEGHSPRVGGDTTGTAATAGSSRHGARRFSNLLIAARRKSSGHVPTATRTSADGNRRPRASIAATRASEVLCRIIRAAPVSDDTAHPRGRTPQVKAPQSIPRPQRRCRRRN